MSPKSPFPSSVLLSVHVLDAVSPRAAGRFAERLFVTPRRRPRPPHERADLAAATATTLRVGDRDLAAWRWGDAGPVVLLVHGWEGRGSQLAWMAPWLVRAGFAVWTFDAPAHGDSPGQHATPADFAAAVAAAAAEAGGLAGVVAHSMGAAGAGLALARGAAIDRAVLVAPLVAARPAVRRFTSALSLSPAAAGEFDRRLERRAGLPVDDVDLFAHAPVAPVLLVHDADDREIPVEASRRLAAAWPAARLLETSGLGHRRILGERALVDGISTFLSGGEPAAPITTIEQELWHRDVRRERAFGLAR